MIWFPGSKFQLGRIQITIGVARSHRISGRLPRAFPVVGDIVSTVEQDKAVVPTAC